MASQYVGVGLHRRRSVIVRERPEGEVVDTVRIDNDPVALAHEIEPHWVGWDCGALGRSYRCHP